MNSFISFYSRKMMIFIFVHQPKIISENGFLHLGSKNRYSVLCVHTFSPKGFQAESTLIFQGVTILIFEILQSICDTVLKNTAGGRKYE